MLIRVCRQPCSGKVPPELHGRWDGVGSGGQGSAQHPGHRSFEPPEWLGCGWQWWPPAHCQVALARVRGVLAVPRETAHKQQGTAWRRGEQGEGPLSLGTSHVATCSFPSLGLLPACTRELHRLLIRNLKYLAPPSAPWV